jgi:hypothetical protein
MIFKPRQKRQTLDLDLEINNHKINRVKEVVFLGVILDENMSWKPHISHVARKVSKSIGIIYKLSFCFSKSALRTLYFSLIYPYLHYCVVVWGSTYPCNLNRIILLQKRTIRIINREAFDSHTDPVCKENLILKFENIYLLYLCKFMYLYSSNLLPHSFDNFITPISSVHGYYTRSSHLLYVPFCRTNLEAYSGAVNRLKSL